MASPTKEGNDKHDAPKQKDTHGIGKHDDPPVAGKQGAMPKAAPAPTLEPTLVEGIDKVLLHRLFPEADTVADASALALEQGRKTRDEGEKLKASQQEPIPSQPEPIP